MKAVIPRIPPDIIEHRKRTGADRWDEMWEGVLHMPPMPNREHQDLKEGVAWYLRTYWARPHKCKALVEINLASPGGWPNDYRIPDILLLTPARYHIDKNEYFDGPPDAVIEIHSPGDESYEKLDFYARLGVPEVWIVERDTKEPEIYELRGRVYEKRSPDHEGWVKGETAGIEVKAVGKDTGKTKLALRIAGNDGTTETLPED